VIQSQNPNNGNGTLLEGLEQFHSTNPAETGTSKVQRFLTTVSSMKDSLKQLSQNFS